MTVASHLKIIWHAALRSYSGTTANQGTAWFAPEVFFGQMYEADCNDYEDGNNGQQNDDDHEGDNGDYNHNHDVDDENEEEGHSATFPNIPSAYYLRSSDSSPSSHGPVLHPFP